MAGDAPSPQERPQAAPEDPYRCFVAAFLRQVVIDARRPPTGTGHWTESHDGWTASRQHEAQEFLLDLHRLAPWVELTGADVDKLQGVLLRAAGLANLGVPLTTGENPPYRHTAGTDEHTQLPQGLTRSAP